MDMKPPFTGNVKEYSMESYICDISGKEVLDNKVTWKYNRNHKVAEIIQCDPKTNFAEISRYSYDNEGKLKEVVLKIESGEQKKRFVYEYQDNTLSQIIEIGGDYKIVTNYDECGNPSEKQTYAGDDLRISTTMYVNLYDENGRLTEKHTIFPSGDSEWIDKFQYDDAGLLIEEQKIRHQIISIARHRYNAKGDLILSDFNPGEINQETLKREIVYGKNNDILEIREYRKGWCYEDRNEEFGLTGIYRYSYLRQRTNHDTGGI
jgi:hypothetical protein